MKKNEIIKDRLEEWVESKGFLNVCSSKQGQR